MKSVREKSEKERASEVERSGFLVFTLFLSIFLSLSLHKVCDIQGYQTKKKCSEANLHPVSFPFFHLKISFLQNEAKKKPAP